MNASRLLISVVVPVFNGAPYLSQAIDSVLRQKYEPLEIIVVDDGSTDDSAAIVRGLGPAVTYCWQPQQGAAAALNHGVARARGEVLAFLDADDLWMPDKLVLQSVSLHGHPEMGVVLGFVEQFISPELDEEARSRLLCPPTLCRATISAHCWCAVPRLTALALSTCRMSSPTLSIGGCEQWDKG